MYYQEKKQYRVPTAVISACVGIVFGFILCRIILIPFVVPNDSMAPSLREGETVIILKHATPNRGDIVLVESPVEPGRYLLKRVAAVEGSTVEVRDRVFFVNNERFAFPWQTASSDNRIFPMAFTERDTMPPVRIGRNRYFLLSDNLDRGFDSRAFGPVSGDRVVGKMIFRIR